MKDKKFENYSNELNKRVTNKNLSLYHINNKESFEKDYLNFFNDENNRNLETNLSNELIDVENESLKLFENYLTGE